MNNNHWLKIYASLSLFIGLGFVTFLKVGTPFGWTNEAVEDQLWAWRYGMPTLQLLTLGWLIDNLFSLLVERMRRADPEHGMPRLALQLGRIVIYATVLTLALNWVFEQSISPILAASGVFGLILGYALRGLVTDIFSGIALHLDPRLSRGDWIDLTHRGREITGKIVDIEWRNVILLDTYDNTILVPNGEFAAALVVNRSRPTPATQYLAMIELDVTLDQDHVLAILTNALQRTANSGTIFADPAPQATIRTIKDGCVTYGLAYHIDLRHISHMRAESLVLTHALHGLKMAGISVIPSIGRVLVRASDGIMPSLPKTISWGNALSQVPLFKPMSPAELARIEQESRLVRAHSGQMLIEVGADGDSMFVVLEGSLAVIVETQTERREVSRLWPGDAFGEMSLLTGAPRSATIVAKSETALLEIQKETMAEILSENLQLVSAFADLVEARQEMSARARAAGSNLAHQPTRRKGHLAAIIIDFFGLAKA